VEKGWEARMIATAGIQGTWGICEAGGECLRRSVVHGVAGNGEGVRAWGEKVLL